MDNPVPAWRQSLERGVSTAGGSLRSPPQPPDAPARFFRTGAGDLGTLPACDAERKLRIRPDTAHAYEAVSDFSLVNLIYAPNLLPLCDLAKSPGYQALFVLEPEQWLPGGEFRHLRLDRETLHRAEIEIERLDGTLAENQPGHQFRALAIFMGIVGMLTDYFTELAVPSERQELFRLGLVLSYLEKNYSLPLTLPEIARHAAVSEVTLYRLFRKGTGDSPINCLNRIRLRHARALLLNTRLPVSEIAAATGFTDSNYFSRCFRKFTGLSPREFRERQPRPEES